MRQTIIPIKPIDEIKTKVRVAAYIRVSTNKEDQQNSFAAQYIHYKKLFEDSLTEELIDIYSDEGITGTSTEKREGFNRMIEDCEKGRIQRIYVKSISRFGRNTVECLSHIRYLKSKGISVYFEKEELDTAIEETEFRLTMMEFHAQEESISISKNVRLGEKYRMERGDYLLKVAPYGYERYERTLIVNEAEAIIVRRIFDDYVSGKSTRLIAEELNEENVPRKDPTVPWKRTAVEYILSNEKYIGDQMYLKRYRTEDFPFVRVRNHGEHEYYYIEESHQPIVTKTIFDYAQKLRKSRVPKCVTEDNEYSPLTGAIHCGVCGKGVRIVNRKKSVQWVCRTHHKNASSCPTKYVPETEIIRAFAEMYNKLKANRKIIITPLISQLVTLKNKLSSQSIEYAELDRQIMLINDQLALIAELKQKQIIYFETDNINTLAEESELKLSVISTFAQAESEKKSESMIWSLKERFKRKKLLTPAPFGYDRPRDAVGNYIKYAKLEINEAEARVVRFIFDAFLAGVPISNICQILMENEIPTKSGNMVWHDGTVQYILGNERYCGNVLTWKTFTSDIFEHTKSVNVNDRDQHLYKNTHDAIISVEKYEAALQLLAQRKLGMRAGLHIMQVVDVGIFQGYVPINHRWIGNDPNAYFEASDSARRGQQTQKIRRSAFSAFDLTGYQVVRGQFMNSRTELPCMSITKDKITFNSTCTRRLTDTTHVQLLLHPTERKLAIRPCSEDDTFSISWLSRSKLPLAIKNVSSPHFCSALFQIMDWNPEFTYRILGTAIEKGNDQIIIFNLPTAMPILVYKEEIEGTNEYKRKRIQMCPDEWGDSFGEEFYDFSLENSLYYSPVNTQWRAGEKCRAVNAPEGFTVPTVKEVLRDADQLKLHWEETHE